VELKGGEDYEPDLEEKDSDEEDSQSADPDDDLSSNDEQKKLDEERKQKEIAAHEEDIGKYFRNIVRKLLNRRQDFDIIKQLNEQGNNGEMFTDVSDC